MTALLGEPAFCVRWHVASDQGRVAHVQPSGLVTGADVVTLGVSLVREGECWQLCVKPRREVVIDAVETTLPAALGEATALYLNGYNSWTDSVERSPRDRMRNFRVPRVAIRHWVLDASGDYRFVKADERPGHQHGFTYGYLRRDGEVALVGSLGEDTGMTLIREDLPAEALLVSKEPPAVPVKAGEKCCLLGLAVVRAENVDEAAARWLALCGIAVPPCSPLVGYTSWYRHYTNISEQCLLHDLDALANCLEDYDLGTRRPTFQMDDGYTRVGDWLHPDAEKFPHGLAAVAAAARERGLMPGIWVAPFVCERESQLFSAHPDWLLRDEKGELVVTGSHWSGHVALDTLNPEVRDYVARVMATLTGEWGFTLLKCDFLYAACMLPHGGMNRGQLMADAIGLLRQSAASGTWFDLCGVPIGSALGRTEFCRIGCDVGLDWDGAAYMRGTGRERVSTKNSLANTRGRAHLDGRAFRCDPDVFFLRPDVRLTDEQRTELLEADSTLGGVLFTSDDMSLWDADQRALFSRALG